MKHVSKQQPLSWQWSFFFFGGSFFLILLIIGGCAQEEQPNTITTTTQQSLYLTYSNQLFSFSYPPAWGIDDHQFVRIGLVMLKQENPLRIITLQIVPKERYKSRQALIDKLMTQVKILHDVSIMPQEKGFSLLFPYQSINYTQQYWVYEYPTYYFVFSLTAPFQVFSTAYQDLLIINTSLSFAKNITFSFFSLPLEVPRTIGLNQREEQLHRAFLDFLQAYEPHDKLVIRADAYFAMFEKTSKGLLRDLNDVLLTPEEAQERVLLDVPSRPLHLMAMVQ